MWWWTRLGTLVMVLSLVSGCGGRSTGNAHTDEGAAAASSGGNTMATGGSGTGPGATAGVATTGGAEPGPALEPDYPPFVVGMPGTPPFEVPWWLSEDAAWSDDWPTEGVCEQGWSRLRVLEEIQGAFSDLTGAMRVDGGALEAIIAMYRDPERRLLTDPKVMGLLVTSDGHVGAVSVGHGTDSIYVEYMLLTDDCRPVRLGNYAEAYEADGCAKYRGVPLWGLPPAVPEARRCNPTGGFYVFEAVAQDDNCLRTPLPFRGVFHYRQWDPTHAELYFVDIAFRDLTRTTFNLYIADDGATASYVEDNACGNQSTTVHLVDVSVLSITDVRDPCEGEGDATCTWKILSENVYGPLD